MSSKKSSGGAGLFVIVVVLIAAVPKPVWIAIGIIVAVSLASWAFWKLAGAVEDRRLEAQKQAKAREADRAAAAKRARGEQLRKEKQQRIAAFGKENAALVESARSAAKQVAASEAARAGWLGDIDFSADITAISDNFEKAHSLRAVITSLSALDKPSAEDRKILAEAKTAAATLEVAAIERVELITRCATEAAGIDESLRAEREDAKVAEQRAELHAQLSAMLYGIEAAPDTVRQDSAADAVMARVQAYREVKEQIDRARAA